MSEMLERVACALYEAKFGNGEKLSQALPMVRQRYRDRARVAIEAMRGATRGMCIAGAEAYENGDPNESISSYGLGRTWDAMIDEALGTQP